MRKAALTLCAILWLAVAPGLRAETPEDREAIRQTALDYIEGYYEGDGTRMERALHPELAKRIVVTNDGVSFLQNMGATHLTSVAKGGSGKNTPKEKQRKDVTILDVFGTMAAVKVDAADWVDYMQMAKWNGRWVIVNVLWERRPKQG